MKEFGTCEIENTVTALQEAIENRRMHIQNMKAQSGSSPVLPNLFSEIFNRAGGSYAPMSNVLEHGREFAQDFLKKAQQTVQENPWEAVRKVAVYSFAIGLFFSLRHRRPPTGEKE